LLLVALLLLLDALPLRLLRLLEGCGIISGNSGISSRISGLGLSIQGYLLLLLLLMLRLLVLLALALLLLLGV